MMIFLPQQLNIIGMARISIRIVKQFWCSYPLKGPNVVFSSLGGWGGDLAYLRTRKILLCRIYCTKCATKQKDMLPVSHGMVENRFWWHSVQFAMWFTVAAWVGLGVGICRYFIARSLAFVQLLIPLCVPSNCAFCLQPYNVLHMVTDLAAILYLNRINYFIVAIPLCVNTISIYIYVIHNN